MIVNGFVRMDLSLIPKENFVWVSEPLKNQAPRRFSYQVIWNLYSEIPPNIVLGDN